MINEQKLKETYKKLYEEKNKLIKDAEEFCKSQNPLKYGDVIKSVGLKYKGRKLAVTGVRVGVSSLDWTSELNLTVTTLAVLIGGNGKLEHGKYVEISRNQHGPEFYQLISRVRTE